MKDPENWREVDRMRVSRGKGILGYNMEYRWTQQIHKARLWLENWLAAINEFARIDMPIQATKPIAWQKGYQTTIVDASNVLTTRWIGIRES